MGIIAWGRMALQDLREASDSQAVRHVFLARAETELRYPLPRSTHDEGHLPEPNHEFAYRRALPRSAPTVSVDLATDPNDVDAGDEDRLSFFAYEDDLDNFPFGDWYYVYRPPTEDEVVQLGERGKAARLLVARLLHVSELIGQLKPE